MAKILVVDDDPEFGTMLVRMLGRAGHSVRLTRRGRDVIDHAAARGFDLLLTDIFMPDIEGLELIRWLRRNQPGLGIIAMSGGALRLSGYDPLRNAAVFGADAVIAKPFEPEALADAVATVLAQRSSSAAAPAAQAGNASVAC